MDKTSFEQEDQHASANEISPTIDAGLQQLEAMSEEDQRQLEKKLKLKIDLRLISPMGSSRERARS